MIDLTRPLTSAFGFVLGLTAHAAGWPLVRGGTAAIASGLAAELCDLGGEIETGHEVRSLAELPPSRVVLLDTTPRAARRSPTSVGRPARSRWASARLREAGTRSGHSCWSPSTPPGIRPGRPTARRRRGRTATCRPDRRST